jgi:hypothetical protein
LADTSPKRKRGWAWNGRGGGWLTWGGRLKSESNPGKGIFVIFCRACPPSGRPAPTSKAA